jgi:hypothetical protein
MVDSDELYKLTDGPGETNNLAAQQPALLGRLDSAYRVWYKRNTPIEGFELLPIPIGYPEETEVIIPPHLGRATGNLKFLGYRGLHRDVRKVGRHPSGVDGDWVSNWTSTSDTICWRIKVIAKGNYSLAAHIRGHLTRTHNVVMMLGERQLRRDITITSIGDEEWHLTSWGKVLLDPGEYTLSIVADEFNEEELLELKNVIITF